ISVHELLVLTFTLMLLHTLIWSGRWELNPRQPAWKAGTLPLSYARLVMSSSGRQGFFRRAPGRASSAWWAGKDSNLGSRWQQIYSLPPLATWVPAQNFQRENSNGKFFIFISHSHDGKRRVG